MSGYQSFAVWGAGNMGRHIISQLLSRGLSTTVLTRSTSLNNDVNAALAKKGVTVRAFDVDAASEAFEALRGIDVLICTTSIPAVTSQSKILKTALDVGVKLYVPNEWGFTPDGLDGLVFQAKANVRAEALQLGLPTAAFFTGLWPEWTSTLGWDIKRGEIDIGGTGNVPFSATGLDDVARFVAYALTSLPQDQVENAKFTLEADKVSFNELATAVQRVSTKSIKITHTSTATLEANFKNGDIASSLLLIADSGKGAHPELPSNRLYPDWNPKSAVDVIMQQML